MGNLCGSIYMLCYFRSPRDASSPGGHKFEDALPAALEFRDDSKSHSSLVKTPQKISLKW